MTIKLPTFFISTHAKIVLNEYRALKKLILHYSKQVRDQHHQDEEQQDSKPFTLLTDNAINDAICGPFAPFLKQIISAYAAAAFTRQQLTVDNDDVLKNAAQKLDKFTIIETSLLKKTSLSEIDRLTLDLDKMTTEFAAEWQEQFDNWLAAALHELHQHEINLSEADQSEFHHAYPISELLDRCSDLKITPPSFKKEQHCDFSSYFTLKLHIAIYNYLNQQHQTEVDKTTKQLLKKFKDLLSEVNNKEQALLKNHRQELDKLLEPIAEICAKIPANKD
jgi:hypothetical protein